jgi:hypothetical protein
MALVEDFPGFRGSCFLCGEEEGDVFWENGGAEGERLWVCEKCFGTIEGLYRDVLVFRERKGDPIPKQISKLELKMYEEALARARFNARRYGINV